MDAFNCFLNVCYQIKAIVTDDGNTSIILNDSSAWVEARISKTLEGHINAGSFEVGHIVEIANSLGSPRDLHIVSWLMVSF